MIELEIDGSKVLVENGSTVMDAASKLGIHIPHFCYHRKLSIAANCRMCLVEVEKAPKPLPACATPATNGMRVLTDSPMAKRAQHGVMEFLLINHPLDCPICDQGGECQLQDLSVGYSESRSRFGEPKRVVDNKDLGPLISTEMTRCIHCTRCVRFGQEIAGLMELGMANRGEHSEIMAFVGQTVNSELSGNVIDLCPVGALTSKPFRYSARTWELARRRTVSPHCGLGANLILQVKGNQVKRAVPRENEAINECWLSDKDRFSYEALESEDRLLSPMVRRGGEWVNCDWETALDAAAQGLERIRAEHGADQLGFLVSPHATLEELYLAQKLARALGSGNVDHRLRQSDFSLDAGLQGAPWLGMSITALSGLKAALVVGSNLRKDHPLLALRLRQAAARGAELCLINPLDDRLLGRVSHKEIVAPGAMSATLARVLAALRQETGKEVSKPLQDAIAGVTADESARAMAKSLLSGMPSGVLLGNIAQHHPDYGRLHALAQEVARVAGSGFGVLGEAANSVGAYLAGAVPTHGPRRSAAIAGASAAGMISQPRKGYVLLNVEPELDAYDPFSARRAVSGAEFVVALSTFRGRVPDYAHVVLPVAPFSETAGTFVNTEGRAQSFQAATRPLGDCRPGWKVLRVLGNFLKADGFDFDSHEAVRAEALGDGDISALLSNDVEISSLRAVRAVPTGALERIGDVPIYDADPLVRRASSLHSTRDASAPVISMCAALMEQLKLREGDTARATQGDGYVELPVARDDAIPPNCVRVPAARPETSELGGMFEVVEFGHARQTVEAS